MSELYRDDLAFVQARGFGDLAAAAAAAVIPRLLAHAARRVVDVGWGAGVSTKAFVDAGFETLAIEPSGALLELARQNAPRARFQQASAYDAALEPCDAVLAFGEALTYHDASDDAEVRIRGFFERAAGALSSRGLLVVDLIETGDPPLDAHGWKAGPDWAVLSASHENVETQRLSREIETFRDAGDGTYRLTREVHQVRVFDRHAVTSWLTLAGFEVETATAYGTFKLARRRVAFFASRR